ncbi:MAG TPA: lactate utilization protein [Bryobacteraceae bacterium]|nr:lactate utilization protein [Bryobacteraceae bacterium]
MSREAILNKVRTALGRSNGQAIAEPPPVRMRVDAMDAETRVASMMRAVEALAGKARRAATGEEARAYVAAVLDGKTAVASNAPFLRECGIVHLAGAQSGFTDAAELRAACAVADVGITSADYALADTGTLVMLASPAEARLISLLPPVHIAVVPKERVLSGLDELLTILPHPAEQTSSMVLITGPSRTADIEQILVRGVHGPGEIHVVVVE